MTSIVYQSGGWCWLLLLLVYFFPLLNVFSDMPTSCFWLFIDLNQFYTFCNGLLSNIPVRIFIYVQLITVYYSVCFFLDFQQHLFPYLCMVHSIYFPLWVWNDNFVCNFLGQRMESWCQMGTCLLQTSLICFQLPPFLPSPAFFLAPCFFHVFLAKSISRSSD